MTEEVGAIQAAIDGLDREDEQAPLYDGQPPAGPELVEQEPRTGTVLSIEDLVGASIVTPSGRNVGMVVEVRTTPAPELRVTSLIVGAAGWIARLRLAKVLRADSSARLQVREIDWEAIDRWDGLRIVLRSEEIPEQRSLAEAAATRRRPRRRHRGARPRRQSTRH